MKITVGVPAHNAELRIGACLDCLLAQTHDDFEILISENGSTDNTAQICDSYAARDSRIKVFHQDPLICMRDNFRFLLNQSTAPLFHWRADDDLSDDNFLATLHDLLVQDRSRKLAGGKVEVVSHGSGGTRERVNPCTYPDTLPADPTSRLRKLLVTKTDFQGCDWFYGLWDRAYLTQVVDRLWTTFDSETLWGTDSLTVVHAIADGCLASSSATTLHKRLLEEQRSSVVPTDKLARLAWRIDLYTKSLVAFHQEIAHTQLPEREKTALAKLAVPFSRHILNVNLLKITRWKLRNVLRR